MEEMIDAEPALAEPVLTLPVAAELAERMAGAAAAGEPVLVVGCGTSEHAAMAGAALLQEALGSHTGRPAVIARDAFEASLDPQDGGVLIAVSHESGTPATLAAAAAARGRGAHVALITARPDLAPAGVQVLATPLRDRSWCHTVGYLSPLLALHAVASRLARAAPDAAAATAALEDGLARRDALRVAATRLTGCERLLAVGSGADEVTARELALKIEEGVHVPVAALGLEKVLHGHLPAHDATTGLILLRLDPRAGDERDARAHDALRAAAELGIPSVLIGRDVRGASELAEVVALEPHAGLPPVAGALLAGAPALQLLTLELAMLAGTNPDLIRREEEPYRAAAAAAEEPGAARVQ
jgi:fructoselysine-6-P-deglycase FrlB-like protein